MIKVPESYGYIECYLTLKCNMSPLCSYCINDYNGVQRKREELTTKEWILGLNNIDPGVLPITLGGGEPTLIEGFYDILSNLRPGIKIDLLTNGLFDVEEFIAKVDKVRFTQRYANEYKSIRISYHPQSSIKPEDLIKKAVKLKDAGFPVGIFSINHPENLAANTMMTELCSQSRVFFFIRDFLGWYKNKIYGYYKYPDGLNGNLKKCRCKTSEFLVDPSGSIFRCHKELYENINPVGNILRIGFEAKDEFTLCHTYGGCSPCDLKNKMSKDLRQNRCSVTIEEQ